MPTCRSATWTIYALLKVLLSFYQNKMDKMAMSMFAVQKDYRLLLRSSHVTGTRKVVL